MIYDIIYETMFSQNSIFIRGFYSCLVRTQRKLLNICISIAKPDRNTNYTTYIYDNTHMGWFFLVLWSS